MDTIYADIILPVPFDTFTYRVPPELTSLVKKGVRAVVPFGKSKVYVGLVSRVHDEHPKNVTIKNVMSVLDDSPIVTDKQFSFWHWISSYYMCSMGDVYKAAYPAGMKKDEATKVRRRKTTSAVTAIFMKNEIA